MKTLLNFLRYHFSVRDLNGWDYARMRRDYVSSKVNVIEIVTTINSLLKPKYRIHKSTGILGLLSDQDVSSICRQIRREGYFVFPNLLPDGLVGELKRFATSTPVHYLTLHKDSIAYSKESVKYIDSKNLSNRYQILDISTFKNSEEALRIVTDENILHIANEYLDTKPIIDLIVMWWSNSLENVSADSATRELLKNRSAQMFHFDMDRLKFLKFFIYLTDVDEKTGPHVYVKGTHNRLPSYIKQDGRYSDEFVLENDAKNVVEINGKAGTIMAVDTRGLHKGKELLEGERLIFQLEFSNSLYGNPVLPQISDKFEYYGNPDFYETYAYFYKR